LGDDDRNDPLKHSRHKRSPKVWRLGQNAPRAIDPFGDEFRVAVFLSNRQADRAEREAVETGLGDLQAWCQATLRNIIDRLDEPGGSPGMFFPVVRHKPGVSGAELEAELGIPDDPAFLREWAGIEHPTTALPGPTSAEAAEVWAFEPETTDDHDASSESVDASEFESMIDKVLSPLREGRRPTHGDAETLAHAVERYAQSVAMDESLPRSVVRSLYRLSLESQVLMTEVHPALGLDLTVVTLVRRLQAAVGAVLDR
jgi:hypothetical protein